MSYGNNFNSNIEPIYTYEDAVRREESIKPIRGKTIKPLAERTKQYLTIRKEGGEGHKPKIIIRLYATDVITFYPTGDITLARYASQTTSRVVSQVMDTNLSYQNGYWIECKTEAFENGWIEYNNDTIFRRDPDNKETLICTNPVYPTQHTINKAKMKEVREKYKAFIIYTLGILKLRAGVRFTYTERYEVLRETNVHNKYGPAYHDQWMEWIDPDKNKDNSDGYYKAMMCMLGGFHQWDDLKPLPAAYVKRDIEAHWLTYFGGELLTKTTIMTGKRVRDTYAKYV